MALFEEYQFNSNNTFYFYRLHKPDQKKRIWQTAKEVADARDAKCKFLVLNSNLSQNVDYWLHPGIIRYQVDEGH